MKKLIFSTLLFISISAVQAQSPKYIGAMKSNLELLKNAKTFNDYLSVSAAFERIGNAEKTLWQPYYFAALSQLRGESEDKTVDKDATGQKIDSLLAKAEAIQKNAELSVLHYYNEVMEMTVDPQTRWQTSGVAMEKYYEQAIAQDSTNPRIYFMKGETVYHTPESFGGGKAAAKPLFQKSVDLFNNEKPSMDFSPRWGREEAEGLLEECSK
ncbi:hypothetical protein A9P82_01815 [Arachidicoccus ginsenosidimutans]|uniref:hypothetical protein n=1 Tax=Arachidicoccus sp. BS20 TaxID=1850526 RepID=UPI0007F18721|nr:hypothetical protein [Arachidicoccus sp. BS20]ANI88157.1 hypothetical protein A9P82_01815 [Arachidicoccus sp. BS20]